MSRRAVQLIIAAATTLVWLVGIPVLWFLSDTRRSRRAAFERAHMAVTDGDRE